MIIKYPDFLFSVQVQDRLVPNRRVIKKKMDHVVRQMAQVYMTGIHTELTKIRRILKTDNVYLKKTSASVLKQVNKIADYLIGQALQFGCPALVDIGLKLQKCIAQQKKLDKQVQNEILSILTEADTIITQRESACIDKK